MCRKLDDKGGLLQILLCPAAAAAGGEARAAAGAAAEQSAGPSLEGLGLTSAPDTPVESPQHMAVDTLAATAAVGTAAAAASGGDAQAAVLAALPPSIAAVVRDQGLAPVTVQASC